MGPWLALPGELVEYPEFVVTSFISVYFFIIILLAFAYLIRSTTAIRTLPHKTP